MATDDLDRSESEKPTDTWLCRKCIVISYLTGHKAKSLPEILQVREEKKHFFLYIDGQLMKEMSKSGGKEKTNKQELDL